MKLLHRTIGCGRVPAVFWGSVWSQGRGGGNAIAHGRVDRRATAYGLILMGDWCGLESATTKNENQGA